MAKRVLFVDRDGTLIEEPADHQVDQLDKVRLLPDVIPALLELRDAGYHFVMVTNQDGLGSETFPTEDFESCQQHVLHLFASQGIEFDEVYVCPHRPDDGCGCRKPHAGLIAGYLAAHNLDLERSAVVGDRDTDLQLAENIGLRGFRVVADGNAETGWKAVVRALIRADRTGTVERKTRETDIRVSVNLDDAEPVAIDTGIGFYDHMLEQVARHGGFSLTVECKGDLEVDEHHTVEDTAICFGNAMRDALGNKHGIERFGFLLPMDESQAQVAIDLSGRAHCQVDATFGRETVGGLPTELVPHFFQSFSDALGAAIHLQVQGSNAHHMVEACFKSVGRALRTAIRDSGTQGVPSTKGTLA